MVLIGLGLLLRLGWALLPLETLLLTLEDDAWMVTAIARHWALGHGITADGLTPTNGFHPLYPLTLGALPFLIAPNDLEWGFRANLIICALLSTAQLGPWYGLLRQVARPLIAVGGLAIIALNPYFVRTSVNAMETSLALLTLTVLWWQALKPEPFTFKRALGLGLLAALASLARLDSLLAAALLGSVLLGREWRTSRTPWYSLVYGATTLGLLAPYFVRNIVQFGALTPSSGRALAYLHSFKESYTFSAGVQGLAYNSALNLQALPAALLALIIVGLLVLLWWLRGPLLNILSPLILYAGVLTFYYSYIQQQGSPRYYGGVALVLVIILTAAWETLAQKQPSLAAPTRVLPIACLAIVINSLETHTYINQQRSAASASQTASYQTALWIRDNLPADVMLGAQNSGIMQYYSGHVVLNFDGKLNHEIIPVLEQRSLNTYLARKGISYIVDLPEVEDYLEFYSARYSDAPAHPEPGTLGKLRTYGRLIAHKIGLGEPVELPERVPERIIRPFRSDATIVHTTPLPNNPQRAITVYKLAPQFGKAP